MWYQVFYMVVDKAYYNLRDKLYRIMSLVPEPLSYYPNFAISFQDVLLCIPQKQLSWSMQNGPGLYDIASIAEVWRQILDESHREINYN